MEAERFQHRDRGVTAAMRVVYGLSETRIREILENTETLEAVVLRLSEALPFEAEPWGFGDCLWRLAEHE